MQLRMRLERIDKSLHNRVYEFELSGLPSKWLKALFEDGMSAVHALADLDAENEKAG